MSYQYKKNIYTCSKCRHQMVTVDRDDGTTPFMTSCPICKSPAQSSFYNVDQKLQPTHEWYKPTEEETKKLKAGTLEHVNMGGLLLRNICLTET